MSMRSWTDEGFGMLLFTGHNEDKVLGFLKQHNPELFHNEEELKMLLEDGKTSSYTSYTMWDFFGEPASWLVANTINKLEGTTIFRGYAPCSDTDQEEMIGIEPGFPWTMNRVDLSLSTRLKATEMLRKYAEILGIDEEPEYFIADYFG